MPITQVITTLPDGPDPAGDPPAVFSQKAAASVMAQKKLVPELNAFATQLNATADKVNTDAAVAATATAAAAAAMATANVTVWASGATVQQYAAVISPANARTYRRKTATGAGTVDPSADSTNYEPLSVVPSAMEQIASVTVSTAVAAIDFLNLFGADYDKYIIEFENLTVSSSNYGLVLYLASAGVVDSTSSEYKITAGSTTGISLSGSLGPTDNTVGSVEIRNANSVKNKGISCVWGCYSTPNQQWYATRSEYAYSKQASISGFRIISNGANITGGTVRVFGIKNKA